MWHDLKAGQLHLDGQEDKIPKIVALVAQAEYGDQTTNVYQRHIYENVMSALHQSANENVFEAIKQVIMVDLENAFRLNWILKAKFRRVEFSAEKDHGSTHDPEM